MANRSWTGSDDQISSYLATLDGNDSEDGAEEDECEENDEEVQAYRDRSELLVLEGESEEVEDDPPLEDEFNGGVVDPSEEDPPIIEDPEIYQEPAVHNRQTRRRQDMRRLLWKKQGMRTSEDDIAFLGDVDYGELGSIDTMYGFFSFFLSDEILEKIVQETNLYAIQKEPNSTFSTSVTEVRNYMGILYFMSVIKYPNVRMYWSPKYGFAHIYNCMTLNRFEKLKSLLHFNNNDSLLPSDHPRHDKLHKIRPVIDYLNNRFALFPIEQRLSIDEQMCATKISHYLKQYLPNKPHKWGFKLFLLCSITGYAHKFEVYVGENNIQEPNEPDLGVTGNVVVRLMKVVPRNINHIVYFDNYYTSIPLACYLHKQKIFCLGTVRTNRLPNNKLPNQQAFMKKSIPRGSFEEHMTTYDGTDVSVTMWKDNKIVTLLSTYVGAEPVQKINRFDKSKKEKVMIDCPQIVKDYNSHMGGVDLLDSYIGRYHISLKNRKWYMRLFHHFLDLAMINSWLAYKKLMSQKPGFSGKLCNLGTFRLEVAETLCLLGKKNEVKRGRPSSALEHEIQAKKKKGVSQVAPVKDVRLDQVAHWPNFCDKSNRCKMPKCTGFTQTICEKCNVSLCYNKRNNCFREYHNK